MALKSAALSEYEIQRQAKIAKNQALLKELQLNAASAGLGPKSSSRSVAPSLRPKKRPAPKVKVEDGPRRTSARVRGIVADSEVAQRKAEEEHDAFREAERAKRQRVSGDLKLSDVVVAGQDWNQSGNWLRNVKPANPYERTFGEDDIKTTTNKEIKELRERMSGLELWEEFDPSRIKITPERIYALNFHPTQDKPLVFAGDKMGNLGLFDGSQSNPSNGKHGDDDDDEVDDDGSPAITTFKFHTRTITSIQTTPSQPQFIYTSSYDSSIRQLDVEQGISTEVYGPASRDEDEPLSGVQIPSTEPHMLYFATLNGTFGMHDSRAKTRSTQLLSLSEKKIGGFSIHPLQPHFVATASLDRTVKLWDLRKMSGKGDSRLPALVGQHEQRLSISHAAFNTVGQVACTSYDDTITVWNFSDIMSGGMSAWPAGKTLSDEQMKPTTVIRHNNQTGRWVTILKPQWQTHPSDGIQRFAIGNMNRFVDVFAGSGEQLAQLGGEGITAVPAVAAFHNNKDWIAAGTASGKLAFWT